MSYLLDKKIKRNKLFKYVLFVIVLFILIYFNSGIFRGLSYVSSAIFHPVLILGNNIGGKLLSMSSYFYSKESLFLENENLKSKLNEDEGRMSNYNSILDENLKMKEILGRKPANAVMVLANILSKPNQSPYDTLVIDVGEKNGIVAGQKVFAVGHSPTLGRSPMGEPGEALGNIPIGRIAEVNSSSSKVILYSNPGEKTEVVISINNNLVSNVTSNLLPDVSSPAVPLPTIGKDTFIQIIGRGGGNFEMILPRDAVLKKGTEAVLPGNTPYTIGIVQTIISDPRDSFQKALLSSPVNIQELKFVEVEK